MMDESSTTEIPQQLELAAEGREVGSQGFANPTSPTRQFVLGMHGGSL